MKVADTFEKNLFWDVNPGKLDWEKNSRFIIERVMVRGGMKDVKNYYEIIYKTTGYRCNKKEQRSR